MSEVMQGGIDTGVWCEEITGAVEKPKLLKRKLIIVMATYAVGREARPHNRCAELSVSTGGAPLIKGGNVICFKCR